MSRANHQRATLLVVNTLITLFFILGAAAAAADGWRQMLPEKIDVGNSTVLYSLDGADLAGLADRETPMPWQQYRSHTHIPVSGFMDKAFKPKKHNGKLGRVVDALGLQSIYNEPLVRNVLGRVKGSRFCLTGGCGINLKLSLRKPGLRFEHKF
jgi:hypothetical protein